MADAPPDTSFQKGDFPSTGLSTQDSLDKLFLPLNTALKAIRTALNRGVTTAQNTADEIKTVTVTTPASGTGVLSCFPFNVSTGVKSVVGVTLIGCQDKSTAPGVPSLGSVSWLVNTDGSIKVTNLPGLLLGRAYSLTLQVISG